VKNIGELRYEKYQNKKGWCDYPFSPDPVGYCWSYATFIDGNLMVKGKKITTDKQLKNYCKNCDCFVKKYSPKSEKKGS